MLPAPYDAALVPDGATFTDGDSMLRVTTVGQADMCFARSAAPFGEPSEFMFRGSVVHRLIEFGVKGSAYPSPGAILALAYELAAEDNFDLDTRLPQEGRAAWIAGVGGMYAAWRTYWATVATGAAPLLVEQRLAAPMGDGLWLAGTPDALFQFPNGAIVGLDWKSSWKGWPPNRASTQSQHYGYRWLLRQHGLPMPDAWWYCVGNFSKGDWQSYQVHLSDSGEAGFMARAQGVAKATALGVRLYTPKAERGRAWWCSPAYCGAWDECPGRYLGDDKDHMTRDAPQSWTYNQ
jgi:hypothetical protein